MRFNRKTPSKLVAAASSFELQALEGRVMFDGTPLKVVFTTGLLAVAGTTGDDNIVVSCAGSSWMFTNGTWNVTKTFQAVQKLMVNSKAGNDTITIDTSVTAKTTLLGDLGNDTITGGSGATSMNGGLGNDSLSAGSSTDTLVGDVGDDTLVGAGGADKLIGGAGDDSISGNGGNDVIQGGTGNDVLSGGNGIDVLDYSDHSALQGMIIDMSIGSAHRVGESDTFTADFEKLSGSLGADNIAGTTGDDIINGQAGNDTIDGLTGNDKIYDGAGNDSVTGGDGDDSLYGQAGNDSLDGGEGDDKLISLGGGAYDSLTGGNGNDSFWCDSNVTETVSDADVTETANGAVHKVGVFMKSISKEIAGQKLVDPTASTSFKYRNFSDRPLFSSAGPSIDDIAQGQTGDCYFLATIASIAKLNAERIRQSVVELGDGTYAVRFFRNNVATYVRVDGDLPTYSWSATTPGYAKFGAEGSMWAPIIEKAFTVFRKGLCTYSSISSGLMNEVYSDFGVSSSAITPSGSADPDSYLASIKSLLDSGKSVTSGCWATGGANMITSHAYTIDHMVDNGDGTFSVVVRNPWGVDGNTSTDGTNDGYVTLTAAQAYVALGWVCAANV